MKTTRIAGCTTYSKLLSNLTLSHLISIYIYIYIYIFIYFLLLLPLLVRDQNKESRNEVPSIVLYLYNFTPCHFRSRRDGFRTKDHNERMWRLRRVTRARMRVYERYRLLINEFPIRALDRSIRAYLLGMRSDLWVKFNIPPCCSINIRLKAASTCRLRIVKQQTRRH